MGKWFFTSSPGKYVPAAPSLQRTSPWLLSDQLAVPYDGHQGCSWPQSPPLRSQHCSARLQAVGGSMADGPLTSWEEPNLEDGRRMGKIIQGLWSCVGETSTTAGGTASAGRELSSAWEWPGDGPGGKSGEYQLATPYTLQDLNQSSLVSLIPLVCYIWVAVFHACMWEVLFDIKLA